MDIVINDRELLPMVGRAHEAEECWQSGNHGKGGNRAAAAAVAAVERRCSRLN